MTYTLIAGYDGVGRDADNGIIPKDMNNGDWLGYQDWLAAGNVPNPAPAGPNPAVTGNQFAFALKTLKLASAWRKASLIASDSDQIRLGLISRTTMLDMQDPLLVRVAALAGFAPDANGQPTTTPVVALPAVMQTAVGMPL